MKRLIGIAVIVVLLVISLLSSVSGASALTADTSVSHNEVTSSESDNPGSASAIITITWTTAPLPDE